MMSRCLGLSLLVACGGADPDDTGTTPAPLDCSTRGIDQPSPRGDVAGAWDAAGERFVLFGGDEGVPEQCMSMTDFSGETWVFEPDCDTFRLLDPADSPKRRGRHTLVADDTQPRLVLHGGRFRADTSGDYDVFSDTWVFDLQTDSWSEIDAPGGPSPRSNHGAVVVGGTLWVYGGNASNDGLVFEPLGDVWSLDLATGAWTEHETTGGPDARLFHAVATDGDFLYVYAGGDENAFTGPFFQDLWALDLTTLAWTELSDGSDGPEGRISPVLAYDAVADQLVVFAGHDDQALGNHNELWTFDLGTSTWDRVRRGDVEDQGANGFCDFPADFTEVDLESPERRYSFASAMAPSGELYVFGGKTDCGIINDVWSFSMTDAAWSQRVRATFGESCTRAYTDCTTLCF